MKLLLIFTMSSSIFVALFSMVSAVYRAIIGDVATTIFNLICMSLCLFIFSVNLIKYNKC